MPRRSSPFGDLQHALGVFDTADRDLVIEALDGHENSFVQLQEQLEDFPEDYQKACRQAFEDAKTAIASLPSL